MEITKNTIVTCKNGDMELRMGNGLTSFYFKGQEKFVFRTNELDKFIEMVQASKLELT